MGTTTDDPHPTDRTDPTERTDPTDSYDALGEMYDEWVVSVTEDLPLYTAIAVRERHQITVGDHVANGNGNNDDGTSPLLQVLELGAGTGRVTLPVAATGCHVTALDLASGQLERLRASAASIGLGDHIETVVGDMRGLDALFPAASFDMVMVPFRSLLHVADQRDAVVAAIFNTLRPGGCLVFDVFHPNAHEEAEVNGRWTLRRRFSRDGGTWSVWERATFDFTAHTLALDVRCEFMPLARSATPPQRRECSMLLHTPPPHAWMSTLESAGFEVESAFGWFDERLLDPSDEDSIWVARRPA